MILSCNEASFKTLNSIFASQLYNRSRDIIFILKWKEKSFSWFISSYNNHMITCDHVRCE